MADRNISIGSDLADLVDYPRETLEIELKEWINLGDRVAQAKLARHMAALANHGGGYLVFGLKDDGSVAPDRPADLTLYNRDTFSAIIKRFLAPAFQCELTIVAGGSGAQFPVVRVPSHGSTPIAARSDGPDDGRGKPQGIKSGVYYVRKPGPESAPAQSVEDWQPLIRRCVLNDRDNLLADIARAVQPTAEPVRAHAAARLEAWQKQSEARWLAIVRGATALQWPVDITANHCVLSYLVVGEDLAAISPGDIRHALEEVNRDVRAIVSTGWSMFYPFTKPEIAAALHPEFDDGTGVDVLESDLIGDGSFDTSLPDYWRVAVDGRAALIRPYREDRRRSVIEQGKQAGTWLSPETVIRETAELVSHARFMAERLGGREVLFRCSWRGLNGRMIDDFGSVYWSPGRSAQAEQRTTSGSWAVSTLAASWQNVVADLACPVLAMFGFNECGPALVEGLAPRFVKL